MAEQRTTLTELPTGKIELVNDNGQVFLQFNCSCLDALPYCQAICCVGRPKYNVELLFSEWGKYPGRTQGTIEVLDYQDDGHCVYHEPNTNLCAIHSTKPIMCKVTHCSPGGVGEGLLNRQKGWLLTPTP
jgi:Predicted Fe-S-cluster oxidoreductase